MAAPHLHACALCDGGPVALTAEFAMQEADPVAVGRIEVCRRCGGLLASDPASLAAHLAPSWDFFSGPEEVARFLHERLENLDEIPPISAEVRRLRAQGFLSLGDFTGDIELVEVWPDGHRALVSGAGLRTDEGGEEWFVRSPWPDIDLPEVFGLIVHWVERDDLCRQLAVRRSRAAEALAWSEQEALGRVRLLRSGLKDP